MAGSGKILLRGRGPSTVTTLPLAAVVIAAAALVLSCGPRVGVEASPQPTIESPSEPVAAESKLPEASAPPTGAVPSMPPAVVDRPGVPGSLYNRYWSVSWGVVGSVGTTATQTLPEGERLLGVDDGFVASSIWLGEGRSPSRILIRAFGQPEPTRTVETDTWIRQGTIVNGVLFWTGPQAAESGDPLLDGGIWALDLRSPKPPFVVVPPGKDLSRLIGQTTAEHQQFQVSPTGRTLASTIAGGGGFLTNFVSTESYAHRALLDESVAGLTDDVAIVRRGGPISSGPLRVGAVAIDSGDLLWTYPIETDGITLASLGQPFVYGDNVAISIRALDEDVHRQLLVSIDVQSGEVRDFLWQGEDEARLYLIPELSTSNQLAMAEASLDDALSDADHVEISLFDLGEQFLEKDAFRIDLP